ncbi:hypothetical protein [Clostridium ljungdahlii]|uniref:Uncharacterized protein n=1 Tax=Clostridium ljungdahlii TaxID=1538 RepID=A0A162KWI0_9CLOT|nr:hypothetical protein [Clostridium ljungdahlii]OAA85086.1 hypothetical protein WY13_02571 [Clostridium ljungdahlii]
MDIQDYIHNYDYNYDLNTLRQTFKERTLVKKYLENNPEENFKKFVNEFWLNPNNSIDELKRKYNINAQISYSDIIKSYPNDKYMQLLKMFYSPDVTIDKLVESFAIPYKKIVKLVVPIHIKEYEKYCPKCFNDSFEIYSNISSNLDELIYNCEKCLEKIKYDKLLSKEQAIEEHERVVQKKIKFQEKMNEISDTVSNIKCPKCQGKLQLQVMKEKFEYIIECEKCNYISYDIDKTKKEYSDWKKRASMMIAIKAKERELIEKSLESKKEEDIFFKKEDIIREKDCIDAIEFLFEIFNTDSIQLWNTIFTIIKSCNRLEKKLLIEIIEFGKEQNKEVIANLKKSKAVFYEYSPEEPIVFTLIDRTKIIVSRQILRSLVDKKLIVIDEEENYILIPEVLVNNLDSIKNLITTQNINSAIRYLIFSRQNFTCMTCGETGRPLKIAYLAMDKNINDLNSMIALCDKCFDLMTKNEILIDGTITFDMDYSDKNKLKSLEFLCQCFPEIKGNQFIYDTMERLESKFSINNIIKALAITIDKIKKKHIEGTIKTLINYTKGILNKGIENGEDIKVYPKLIEEYNLDKWIIDEL